MYPISNAVKALFESEQRQVLRITGTDRNGASIHITEANEILGGFNIDRYSCNGARLEIGTAIAAEMTLKLDNRQGQYNGIVFEGTELYVEIGIADWSEEEPEITYIPCGYFTPDEQPRSLSTITIHALDRMVRFDTTEIRFPWTTDGGVNITDGSGNVIEFLRNVRFPATVGEIVSQMAALLGIPFTQSISNLPNYNYLITEMPELQQQCTFRNLLQWCAGIMGCNAWIDWTGSLRFSWYGEDTGYVTTIANRFTSDLHEDDITITGVQYTNTQGATIVSGNAGYAIDMTGNYLAATGIATILPAVNIAVNGFTYRPFSVSVINAPYLWPMDMITFTDKDGNDYDCALTNVNFGINGTTVLEGKGETAQTNKGTAPNGMTNEQAFFIEKAAETARELDSSLDQEGIFNRLTDNGAEQGLILYDGKLYLNASYIKAGTVSADILKGGVLKLGGEDNINGVMQVLDADGNIIGIWDRNGIKISSGSLQFDYSNGDYCYINKGLTPVDIRTTNSITNKVNVFQVRNGEVYFYFDDVGSTQYLQFSPVSFSFSDWVNSHFLDIRPYGIFIDNRLELSIDDNTNKAKLLVGSRSTGNGYVEINGDMTVDGGITATTVQGTLRSYNGASFTFATGDGRTVTVTDGIITGVS